MARFRNKRRFGFTLVEIIVVIVIIAIISSFVVPSFLGTVRNAKNAKATAEFRSIINAITLFRLDHLDSDKIPSKPEDIDKFLGTSTLSRLEYNKITFIYGGLMLSTSYPNGDPADRTRQERVTFIGTRPQYMSRSVADPDEIDDFIDYTDLD